MNAIGRVSEHYRGFRKYYKVLIQILPTPYDSPLCQLELFRKQEPPLCMLQAMWLQVLAEVEEFHRSAFAPPA